MVETAPLKGPLSSQSKLSGGTFSIEARPNLLRIKRIFYTPAGNSCGEIRDQKKNHDSQRRDRILRFFLRPEIGQYSPYFGAISLRNYTVNPEKKGKIHWRNSKKSVETAPRNCRFLSLVVVERVLINSENTTLCTKRRFSKKIIPKTFFHVIL